MNEQKQIEIEADRILRLFSNSGAKIVQPTILQQADTLLDLYGEDIRARAYVTSDPFNGEMMLRPDFTVPIVKTHMNDHVDISRNDTKNNVVYIFQEFSNVSNQHFHLNFLYM